MEREKKCGKCQKTLKIGVKCVKCGKWYHNKCESREPCAVTGYVCKICVKVQKNLSDTLTKPKSDLNLVKEPSAIDLESENTKLKKTVQELSDRLTEQLLEIENLKAQLEAYSSQANVESSFLINQDVDQRNADCCHSTKRPGDNPNLNNWTPVTSKREPNHAHPGPGDLGARDVLPLKNRYSILASLDSHSVINPLQENPTSISPPQRRRRRRVLLLSDSHGRQMSSKLSNQLGGDFSVTGFVKPNAGIQEVTKCIEELTVDFTSEDSVIIIGGTNNVQNSSAQSQIDSVVDKVSPLTKKMNVIVSAVPARYDKPELNETIREMNDYMYIKMKQHEASSSFKFDFLSQSLNSQCFTKHGLHLNQRGKSLLCDRLAYLVKSVPVDCKQIRVADVNNNINF